MNTEILRSVAALKRAIKVGTRIECLNHWMDQARPDLPPLSGDVRDVTKIQGNSYECHTRAREGKFWAYYPKAAEVIFRDDGTWTQTYGTKGTATFRIVTNADVWDMRGGPLWLDREQWGVITDALIEHRASATARKGMNSASNSDVRAEMCVQLIQTINTAAEVDQ